MRERSAECWRKVRPARLRAWWATLVAATLVLAADAAAQETSRRDPPRNHVHIDVQPVGVALGYARRLASGRALGVELGGGGNFLEYMAVGGRHFAEDGGLAYQERDGYTDKLLFELFSLSLFLRHVHTGAWHVDTGVRASGFFHLDSSDDDPGGGTFGGAYVLALYGWRNVKLGSRVLVGAFTEGDDPEFGVHVAFVVGRVTFGW